MGIFDIFSPKEEQNKMASDPLSIDLSRMKKGFFVNYDMKTYHVTGYAEYDWGEGYITQEWELDDGEGTVYLEREKDDKVYWEISKEINDPSVKEIFHLIIEKDDPPEEIALFEETFYLEESGAGYFCKDGKRPGKECVMWSFENEEGEKYFSIYQWGEKDFTAYLGHSVEEYQFTEITPGENNE